MSGYWFIILHILVFYEFISLRSEVYIRDARERTKLRDRYIINDVYDNNTRKSTIECMTLCSEKSKCLSYSFNTKTQICQLRCAFLNNDLSLFTEEENWTHYNMKGCPYLWTQFGESCFKFINSHSLDWYNAKVFCEELPGKLAEIETLEEQIFLSSVLSTLNASSAYTASAYPGYWVGGYRDQNDTWKWTSYDSLVQFQAWQDGEPNGFVHHENCIMLFPGFMYKWADWICSDPINFICERDII